MDSVVDTGYRVSTVWSDPRGTSNRFTVADPVFMNGKYSSVLEINYLQSSDTGTYTCSASVSPDPASAIIRESEVVSERESIDVGELVGIFNKGSGQFLSRAALVWCLCSFKWYTSVCRSERHHHHPVQFTFWSDLETTKLQTCNLCISPV